MPLPPSYNETLLHWIWGNRHLANRRLETNKNKPVIIHHPGNLNATDGPDFINAEVSIGTLRFHGDVEIHWSAQDWFRHAHHTDKNYNRVILHVVFNDEVQSAATRPDQTAIPTLFMKPFLRKPLQIFFEQFQQPDELPCSGNLSFISSRAFEQQIAKAHKEYFEQKVNDLLQFYDPDLPLSEAWQKLLIIALFSGLGIMHNREPMQQLARQLLQKYPAIPSKNELISTGLETAGIEPSNKQAPFCWKHKGSRPNNHPKVRIQQACELLWVVKNMPFTAWLRTGVHQSFEACSRQLQSQPGIGTARRGVLLGTVWIPTLYILGDLLKKQSLTSAAYDAWLHHRTTLPASVTGLFEKAGIPASAFRQKLGTVHQLRTYCRPHRCGQCKVFKELISS